MLFILFEPIHSSPHLLVFFPCTCLLKIRVLLTQSSYYSKKKQENNSKLQSRATKHITLLTMIILPLSVQHTYQNLPQQRGETELLTILVI